MSFGVDIREIEGVEAAAATVAAKPRRRAVMRAVAPLAGESPLRQWLAKLRAIVLLDGTIRKSAFAEAIDRSLLELPLTPEKVLLDVWREEIAGLSRALEMTSPAPGRIILGNTTRAPSLRPQDQAAKFTIRKDPAELRGTGGVLRDLAEEFDDDDVLLVANAAQVFLVPLAELILKSPVAGDVTVFASNDGAPVSLMVVRCGALRELPAVGFIDLKEQGLPLMAKRHDIRIACRPRAAKVAIRTPSDYIEAVAAYQHTRESDASTTADADAPRGAFAERWRRRFSLIEHGALVARDALLHDAVVLRNATVEEGAVVAQSIVCGGAVIRRHERVLRQAVSPGRRMSIE